MIDNMSCHHFLRKKEFLSIMENNVNIIEDSLYGNILLRFLKIYVVRRDMNQMFTLKMCVLENQTADFKNC